MQAAEETKDTVVSSIAPNLTRNWGGGAGRERCAGSEPGGERPRPSSLLQCSVSVSVCVCVCGLFSPETQLHVRMYTEPKPTDMPVVVVWVARGKKEVVISQPASAFGCIGEGGLLRASRLRVRRGGHGME